MERLVLVDKTKTQLWFTETFFRTIHQCENARFVNKYCFLHYKILDMLPYIKVYGAHLYNDITLLCTP